MWEGFHHIRKVPVQISVTYDEELQLYTVDAKHGLEEDFLVFTPKVLPIDNLMHISDLEKSVKLANNLIKELRRK